MLFRSPGIVLPACSIVTPARGERATILAAYPVALPAVVRSPKGNYGNPLCRRPAMEGCLLDALAPPLRASIRAGYGGPGFQATAPIFLAPGRGRGRVGQG